VNRFNNGDPDFGLISRLSSLTAFIRIRYSELIRNENDNRSKSAIDEVIVMMVVVVV